MHHSRSVSWLTCWAALVQQFLHVTVTEGKSVLQPDSVLDDGHGETVAVGLGVDHEQSAYPNPVKATQPPVLILSTSIAASDLKRAYAPQASAYLSKATSFEGFLAQLQGLEGFWHSAKTMTWPTVLHGARRVRA